MLCYTVLTVFSKIAQSSEGSKQRDKERYGTLHLSHLLYFLSNNLNCNNFFVNKLFIKTSSSAVLSEEWRACLLSINRFLSLLTSPSYKSFTATLLHCFYCPAFRAQATYLCCINYRAETTIIILINDWAAWSGHRFHHYCRANRILQNDIE